MVHEDYKEMIPARALSALDAAEAQALNEHLENCAECRKELDEWQATAAALALGATPTEPSPRVRERILDEVRRDLSEPNVVPFRSTPRNLWSSFGSLGAMAAAILMTGVTVGSIILWRENRKAEADLRNVSAQLDKTEKDLDSLKDFYHFLTHPDTRVHRLVSTKQSLGPEATLAYDGYGNVLMIGEQLPSVPQGKAYQLWFLVPGKQPLPGKTFIPDNSGKVVLKDELRDLTLKDPHFAVTVEPAGGSTAPTSPIYLSSSAVN